MVSWMHPEKKAVSRLNSDALVTQLPSNSQLVYYLSVLSWGISFQLVEKPAEIKLIIIPDDFRNFIDGIGCCFK